jgi:hypothetical protein
MRPDLKFSDLSHSDRATLILALRDRAETFEQRAAQHDRPEFAEIDRAEASRTRAILAKVQS